MTVRIKMAETTCEIDAIFRLRHQVMVEEEGYMSAVSDRRICDRFDAYPTTGNVVALMGDRVVGAIRFIEETSAGTSADDYFDFRPYLPPGARPAASSLLVVAREYRSVPRLTFAMNGMGYYWALLRGITHILAPANPERREAFLSVGHHIVAPEFFCEKRKLPVLPMILELASLNDRFLSFVQHQGMHHWLQSFDREFHSVGDIVLHHGEVGQTAYVVVNGTAAVTAADGRVLSELHPGDLFGELALLTPHARTTTVVAKTELDLMVLSRARFRTQLRSDPAVAEKLLELIANRFAMVIGGRA